MKRKRKYNFLFLVLNVVVSVTAAIGFSYAAYVYNNLYDNVVDYNTGSFSEYFQTGDGTESTPYVITTPDHLRNLQHLNVLGVFSENTYFNLGASFTWSGDDLYPIGTEDNPFTSQFNGMGHTITALTVQGAHTNDIGMFGYVGITSTIKNFILAAPLIKVNIDNNPNKLSTTNILANYLENDAASLALTLDNSTRKYFTINKTAIVKDGLTFDIKFISSDTNLLEWSNAQNRFNVKIPPNAETNKFYHVQLSAHVYAEYNGMVISHTLERWQINVKHDGTVNVKTNDHEAGHWKTIHAAADEGAGPHTTYVGIFIGHLDGIANYLGLYGGTGKGSNNGRIEVSGRPARSYSILIGRTFDDNLKDDANGTLRNKQLLLTEMDKNNKTFNIVNDTNFSNSAFYTDTQNNALTASDYVGIDATEQSFMRIYPGNPATEYIKTHNYQEIIDDAYESKTSNVLQFNGGLKTYGYDHTSFYGVSNARHATQDGFWFYLSSNAVGNTFFTNTKDYEVSMNIKYTAKGDAANKFQILYNFWDLAATTTTGFLKKALDSAEWMNLKDNNSAQYNPDEYPVIQSYDNFGGNVTNPMFEYDISFLMTRTGISFFSDRKFMFSLGVGSGNKQVTNGTSDSYRKSYFNLTNPSTFELNILAIDVTISSLDGNVNRQVFLVDYINNTPTYNAATDKWTNWNGFSNVKMHFNVTDSIFNLNNGAATGHYRFWRNSGSGTPAIRYAQTTPNNNTWRIGNTDGHRNGTEDTSGY